MHSVIHIIWRLYSRYKFRIQTLQSMAVLTWQNFEGPMKCITATQHRPYLNPKMKTDTDTLYQKIQLVIIHVKFAIHVQDMYIIMTNKLHVKIVVLPYTGKPYR